MQFDNEREQLLHHHNLEKEDMSSRFDNEREELHENLASLQRDRDDALLMAENDKQQVGRGPEIFLMYHCAELCPFSARIC